MSSAKLIFPLTAVASWILCVAPAQANDLIKQGQSVQVAKSNLTVLPPRDWNKLSARPGKKAEIWTLDGEMLNDVSFYGGIAPGEPLLKERHKKRDPLPKLRAGMLLTDIPELLEGTYRSKLGINIFAVIESVPTSFLGNPAIRFTYKYAGVDDLSRKGEATATLIAGHLYMISYDAPRLHYYDQGIADYRNLVAAASLK